ncbi:hypothetical protein V8E53_005025 [Lactarius tabidus]
MHQVHLVVDDMHALAYNRQLFTRLRSSHFDMLLSRFPSEFDDGVCPWAIYAANSSRGRVPNDLPTWLKAFSVGDQDMMPKYVVLSSASALRKEFRVNLHHQDMAPLERVLAGLTSCASSLCGLA